MNNDLKNAALALTLTTLGLCIVSSFLLVVKSASEREMCAGFVGAMALLGATPMFCALVAQK